MGHTLGSRRYPGVSRSTAFSVNVYYDDGPDDAFYGALMFFARRHGLCFGGSGGGAFFDISFCCGSLEKATEFAEQVKQRFVVKRVTVHGRSQKAD